MVKTNSRKSRSSGNELTQKTEFKLYTMANDAGVFDLKKGYLICGPTASGKSKIGRDIILKQLQLNQPDTLMIYLVPYKALAEEVHAKLLEDIEEAQNQNVISDVEVAIATSDYNKPFNMGEIDVLVATYERAIGLLNSELPRWPEVVVADEFHIIGDDSRGPQIESLMAHLSQRENTRVYALSAVLKDPERIADWMGLELIVGGSDVRPTTLKIHIKETSSKGAAVERIVKKNLEHGNILVFCNSKKGAQNQAESLKQLVSTRLSKGEKKAAQNFAMEIKKDFPYLVELPQLLENGVAYHHADLEVEVRNRIVNAFAKQIIKFIGATPTLAAGVNVPARVVILRDIQRFNAKYGGNRVVSVAEALNMLGRAGRPFLNEEGLGFVIVMKKEKARSWCDNFLNAVKNNSPEHLNSRIPESISNIQIYVLSLVARLGDAETEEIVADFNSTLWAYDTDQLESLPDNCRDVINERIGCIQRNPHVGFAKNSVKVENESIVAKAGSNRPYSDYELSLSATGVSCTCRGYRFHKKSPKLCKHISELQVRIVKDELAIKGSRVKEIAIESLEHTILCNRPDYRITNAIDNLIQDGFLSEEDEMLQITEDGRRALVSYLLTLEHITLLRDRIKSRDPKNTDEVIDWAIKDYSPDPEEEFPKKIMKPFKMYLKGKYYRTVFKQDEIKKYLDAKNKLDQIFRVYEALTGNKGSEKARMIRDARRRVHYGCKEDLLPLMILDRPQIRNPEIGMRFKEAGIETLSAIAGCSIEEIVELMNSDKDDSSVLLQSAIELERLVSNFRWDNEIPGDYRVSIDTLSVRTGISVNNLEDYVLELH